MESLIQQTRTVVSLGLLFGLLVACATSSPRHVEPSSGKENPVEEEDSSILTRRASPPDLTIPYGADADQVIDMRYGDQRATQRPLVLLLHGGFWRPKYDRVHTAPMAVALASAGWTVATAEYRRIPGDPDATLQDISRAFEALPANVTHHDGRIVAIGHSAGGHLALWLAATRANPGLAGSLALAPVADLTLAHSLNVGSGAVAAFLGEHPERRADVNPRQLAAPGIPVTIVHGEDDDTVPIAVSDSYVATHPNVRLVRLKQTRHFAVIDPLSTAWPTVVAELEQLSR